MMMSLFEPGRKHKEVCKFTRIFFKEVNCSYENKCFCKLDNLDNLCSIQDIIYFIQNLECKKTEYGDNHFHMNCVCTRCHINHSGKVCFDRTGQTKNDSYLNDDGFHDYRDDYYDYDYHRHICTYDGFCIHCTKDCYKETEDLFQSEYFHFQRTKSIIKIQRWWKQIITDPTSNINNPRLISGYISISRNAGYSNKCLRDLQFYLTKYNIDTFHFSYDIQSINVGKIQNLVNFLNRCQGFTKKERFFITQMALQNKIKFDMRILIILNLNKIKVDFITYYKDGIILLPIMNTYLKISTSYKKKKTHYSEFYKIYENKQLVFETKDFLEIVELIFYNMNDVPNLIIH